MGGEGGRCLATPSPSFILTFNASVSLTNLSDRASSISTAIFSSRFETALESISVAVTETHVSVVRFGLGFSPISANRQIPLPVRKIPPVSLFWKPCENFWKIVLWYFLTRRVYKRVEQQAVRSMNAIGTRFDGCSKVISIESSEHSEIASNRGRTWQRN